MQNLNQSIADLEVARALLHERIKNGLSKKVAKFYDEMIASLQAQILSKKNIANNLTKTISDLKKVLAVPSLENDFVIIAKDELQSTQNAYNKAAGFEMFSYVLKPQQVESLLNTTLIEGATLGAWMRELGRKQQNDLEKALKIGVSLGENNYDLAKRIAALLNISKRNATTIAITGAGAIVSEARQKFFETNDDVIKYYQYQATLDSRTSDLCRAYDNLLWDTEYKPVGHNLPFRTPRVNTHWNCRSTIIPVTKSWEELGIKGLKNLPKGTRSSINGYVPKDMNFNDWLKRQTPEFIEKTLGKHRAELFLDGKITMRDLITQQGKTLNLAELYKKQKLNEYDTRNIKHFEIPKKLKKKIKLKTDKIRGSIDYLYEKHPEMFESKEAMAEYIAMALVDYDFIKPSLKESGVIIGKSVDDKKKKMIDIGININDGVIFHINKKKWDTTMKDIKNRQVVRTPYTHTGFLSPRGVNVGLFDEPFTYPFAILYHKFQ